MVYEDYVVSLTTHSTKVFKLDVDEHLLWMNMFLQGLTIEVDSSLFDFYGIQCSGRAGIRATTSKMPQ